jgi:hypothetical protein
LRNIIRLVADGEVIELPEGFSRRLALKGEVLRPHG